MPLDDPLLRIPAGTATAPKIPARSVALRSLGAAGMGSLLALTAYMTVGASAPAGEAPVDTSAGTEPAAEPPSTPIAAAPSTATPSTSTTVAACDNRYTVLPGDGWLRIARRASISVAALYAVNQASDTTPLLAGETICLPPGAAVAPVTAVATTTRAGTAPPTTAPRPATTTAKPAAPKKKVTSSSHSS